MSRAWPNVAAAELVPSHIEQSAVDIIERADKTYLLYSAEGLGDVYELERTTVDPERIPTEIELTSSPNPSSGVQSVTITATLTADYTIPLPHDWLVNPGGSIGFAMPCSIGARQ